MKIAIISCGFTGATLPLANHLHKQGVKVDCYYFVRNGSRSIESMDFESPLKVNFKLNDLPQSNIVYNYLDKDIKVNTICVYNKKRRLEKFIIGKIPVLLNNYIINKFAIYICSKHYDLINVIVHTELEVLLCEILKKDGIRFAITYHEVLTGHTKIPCLKDAVKNTLKLNVPIIVHSEKTKKDLIQLSEERISDRINLIHFGQFESYLAYGKGKAVDVPKDYYLYFGYIHPYKGLRYLYEAIKDDKCLKGINIVVAGKGNDPILANMEQDEQFTLIHRFIDNNELVYLIKNCKAIICPYISGSQSGIVQTGMVYNKPIIATKVAAFEEIIKEGINGYLAEPANSVSLADAITRCESLLSRENVTFNNSDLNWDLIAKKYLKLL